MKNKISVLLLALITAFMFTGCDEDEVEPFFDPTRLMIGGPGAVSPSTSHDYTIGNIENAEGYTWTVEGPARIVGAASGATVTVEFTEVGTATIMATNGADTGRLAVDVENVEPTVTAVLDTTRTGALKALRSGESDTVFFNFDAPISGMPELTINTEDSTAFNQGNTPFVSGALGELSQLDNGQYYAIYTAGEGNGTAEARFSNIIATSAYGADTVETAYVQLYRVDNIAPVADLSYSQESVNAGTTVTVTATFSEAVMSADSEGALMYVTFPGGERDTLMATNDPEVYTFEYEVGEGANGAVQFEMENIVDMAGNELAGINNASDLMIDNTNPTVTGNARVTGNGVSVTIGSSEAGTGMYLILEEGMDAPTTPEEFMDAEGAASRSMQFTAGGARTVTQALAAGDYVVYFLVMDKAGNYSEIESTELTVN